MVSKSLRAAAEELGFTLAEHDKSDRNYLYGVYGDYLLTLHDNGNCKTVFLNYYLPNEENADESVLLLDISEALKSVTEEDAVVDYDVQPDGLSCTVNGNMDRFLSLIDRLVEMAQEKNLIGVTRCSCCGNLIGKRLPKKMTKQKQSYLLCEHCALEKLEEKSETPSPAQNLPKKTVLGTLGALLGGILGILLYVLTYRFLSVTSDDASFDLRYLFCLFGFVTALFVYIGFTRLSKRPCVSAYAIVSVIALLCTAVGQYIGSFIGYAQMQGFSVAQAMKIPSMWLIHFRSTVPSDVTLTDSMLKRYDISGSFYRLLLFSLIFAAIGVLLFLMGMHDKAKVDNTPISIETLRIAQTKKSEETDE